MLKSVKEHISKLEKDLVKLNFILNKYPDVKFNNLGGFNSKIINKNYSHWEFESRSMGLYVMPYSLIDFEYNGISEKIKIYSIPRKNRLAYFSYSHLDKQYKLKFSKYLTNMKKNSFKTDMIDDCRVNLMEYIQQNTKWSVDQTHLEDKLKKLLAFI